MQKRLRFIAPIAILCSASGCTFSDIADFLDPGAIGEAAKKVKECERLLPQGPYDDPFAFDRCMKEGL